MARKERKDKGTHRAGYEEVGNFSFRIPKAHKDLIVYVNQQVGQRGSITPVMLEALRLHQSQGKQPELTPTELAGQLESQLQQLTSVIDRLLSGQLVAGKSEKSSKSKMNMGYLTNLKQALRYVDDDED